MKISIIGHSGCGKSTLARKISGSLSIPHLHIDRFWFAAGGNKLAPGENPERDRVRAYIRERVQEALTQESWVSDGFYPHIQSDIARAADQIIYIDTPLWRRLFNHFERILHRHERHPEVSLWDDIAYFPDMIRRHIRTKPKLEQFISEHKNKIITLRSRREIQHYLDSLIHKPPVVQFPHT